MNSRVLPIVTFTCALFIGTLQARSQEVFNILLQSATRVVNSPTSNFTAASVAQFKRTALTYMRTKAFENMDSVTASFLDTQAYAMSEFTTEFFQQVVRTCGDGRRQVVERYMRASQECPMWNDPDKETTESYMHGEELTPFSLDTDWEKALAKVKEEATKPE